MTEKIVTVLMPVYNAEKYLNEAIESILNQTYTDFDFLIINDGSTDGSEEIIRSYKDQRIIYVKNEANIRLVATLNKGLVRISTKYIVRMDADDISLPDRIEKLVEFMEKNQGVDICGSYIQLFGNDNAVWKYELEQPMIRAAILFGVPVGHATCIFRAEAFKRHQLMYSEEYIHMEDYDLWLRAFPFAGFANIPLNLYHYRVLEHNVTRQNWATRKQRFMTFYLHLFGVFGIGANAEEIELHVSLGKEVKPNAKNLRVYKNFLDNIVAVNRNSGIFDQAALRKTINKKWNQLYFSSADAGFKAFWTYVKLSRKISWTQLRYFMAVKFKPQRKK